MIYDYDVIVVGARCAGASTAMLLARLGHRVLLVDRAQFPSEIPHGHFIHRHGPPRLARWGLLDRITATGCPPAMRNTSYLGDFPLVATELQVDGIAWGYGPRRAILDKILVDAAVDSGAELREGLAVEGVLSDGNRVTGIRPAHGAPITALLTIGADGKHSRIAESVKAHVHDWVPPRICWYFTYFRDVPDAGVSTHVLPRRQAIIAHPTNDQLLAVFVGWPIDEFRRVRADIQTHFMAALDLAPGLAERLRAGQRAERFYGTADMPQFFRQPCGPGWALVGDAGCHKDPILALGVCDALRDAELLANAADEALTGNCPLEAALANYQRRRDNATLADYRQNVQVAQLNPIPPDLRRLRQALRDNPTATTQFFLARYGRIPHDSFFNPDNLERILGSAPESVLA
jgi:2-polyprenyl-6-methoxyphenol hydroxylase-like FAD-dependent oxidoreductase